jgi:hypothetical protein
MFVREKAGAGVWHIVGFVIGGAGVLLLALTWLEACYGQTPTVHRLTDLLGYQFPLLGWVLDRLPTDTGTDLFAVLLSGPGIVALCLMGIGAWMTYRSRRSFTILGKASETRRLRQLLGDDASNHQSIGDITGNGQVNISQTAELLRRKEAQRSSWKRPIGAAVGLLVVVGGARITTTLGLTP